jgi:leucyl-tRNA synthetase
MHNEKSLQARSISLLGSVDLYIGGNEHATGHLLYSFFGINFKRQGFANGRTNSGNDSGD